MDSLQQLGDSASVFGQFLESQSLLAFLTLIFLSVFLGVLGSLGLSGSRTNLGQRMSDGTTAGGRAGPREAHHSRTAEIVARYALRVMSGKKDSDSLSSYSKRMIQAGYYEKTAVGIYYAWRLMLALALPTAFLLFSPLLFPDAKISAILWFALVLSGVGFLLPNLYLMRRIAQRQLAVREGFPDALDLLLVCVEAGLGLDAAISRVGQEIATAHPILSEQFQLTALELRAGKARSDALRTLSDRVGIVELTAFVTLLNQSDALGTSIADALRVHAREMRDKRMLRAEEKAHKLPVKLSIPLIFLVLPALMIVILAPAVIDIVTQLLPMMKGVDFSVLNQAQK